MHLTKLTSFCCDYKQILLDEIALEGLEGIGLDLLWRRVEKRISAQITAKMKERYWTYIIKSKDIVLYKLPEPVEHIEIFDRFTIVDASSGHIKDPGQYLDGSYEYHPIENEFGSSKYYSTRCLIPNEYLNQLSYIKFESEYADTVVLVASIEERWRALANHVPILYLNNLSPIHYCLLELVGKSRENGQMTIGTTNITKVIKEPKTLFYNRKHLQDLDLIRVQFVTQVLKGRGVKSLLLRLKRFHQPKILSMPKVGILHNMVDYLSKKPNYCEKIDVMINNGLLTQPQCKKLRKTINVFKFKEKCVVEGNKNKGIKRKYICLSSQVDESASSDEENIETPLKCQYKVGVNLLRQAYEQFMIAGLKGLTQVELSQLLGIEFYTSRTICRIFRMKHLVREFLEDKGRQRTARFIAVASTGKMDKTYAEEKKKFLDYLNESNTEQINVTENIMEKKLGDTLEEVESKIEIDIENKNESKLDDLENCITEIKVLAGFENVKVKSLPCTDKNLSLRQLKFANGLLKVVKEKVCVCGYQSLSNLVAYETGEPKMDAKCLKSFLQKLVTSGHLKMFKVKWPGLLQRYSYFICAPHIKANDPIIKAKYKEISIRAACNKKDSIKRYHNTSISFSQLALPRYMKIQKLHEFLMIFAYFNPIKSESHNFPQGFLSVIDIIPEFTIEFVIGNISNASNININELNIDDNLLGSKLRDAPSDLHKALLECRPFHITIRLNLKVLAMLGLIQLIYQPAVQTAHHNNCGPSTFLLYVNRHAKLLNTTGSWPKPNVDKKKLDKSFYFESFDDVKNYWNAVYYTSISTKVLLPKRERRKDMPLLRIPDEIQTCDNDDGIGILNKQERRKDMIPLRMPNEVQVFDNGERYCDGLGPCGFDSSFFMELRHLWNATCIKIVKAEKVQKKLVILPKLENKTRKQKKKVKKITNAKSAVNKVDVSNKQPKKRLREVNTLKWSKEEDHILMLCKAAISILSPVFQPGCLTIRNLVAKDILSLYDPNKTKSMCHRRALVLESNSTLQHEKDCILNEMRRRRNLIEKYEGFLKKIKLRYAGNMSKFVNEARLPMTELVWILSQVARKSSMTAKISCIATNIEDFNNKYTIIPSTANKLYNIYQDPEYAVLKETIILTTFLSFKNDLLPSIGNIIYCTFKRFPEISLRIALDQLRKCGAIAAKEKLLNNLMHKFRVEDMIKTSYKISVVYQRKWINRFNSDFVENLGNILDLELTQVNCKGSTELNCLLLESQAYNAIEITSSTIPAIIDCSGTSIIQEEQLNVIDIETKYKLKSGNLTSKSICDVKKFSDLYKDLSDLDEYFRALSCSAIVDETFKVNEKYNGKILTFLNEKGENGSTFAELERISEQNTQDLVQTLKQMENENIIKRVGFHENLIVLVKFATKWCIKIGEINLIPSPWLCLKAEICHEIFFKWCAVVMNKVFENAGCTLYCLAESCEFLTPRAVHDICGFLKKYGCIKLNIVKSKEVDLFSDDDYIPEVTDYHEYESVHNIVAFPVANSVTKYTYLKKKYLEKYCCDNRPYKEK